MSPIANGNLRSPLHPSKFGVGPETADCHTREIVLRELGLSSRSDSSKVGTQEAKFRGVHDANQKGSGPQFSHSGHTFPTNQGSAPCRVTCQTCASVHVASDVHTGISGTLFLASLMKQD